MILIQNVLNGNPTDEKILYDKYKKIIKDFILVKYSSHQDIDDDISEILIKVFLNLKNYDSTKSKFKSWVLSITKNHMIDKWRCNSNTVLLSLDNISCTNGINNFNITTNTSSLNNNFNTFTTTANYSVSTSQNFENCNAVTFISTQLSTSDFTLLNMKYVQGYNYDEIGREFQITSTTVSNKINYIKTKLKKNIPDDIYD